jgi:beta-carotene/zeaxanthin 4-ketolase
MNASTSPTATADGISPRAPLLPVPPTPQLPPLSARRQTLLGLAFFAAVFGSWLAIHAWALFGLVITARTWPWVPVIIALQCWLSVGMFIVAHDAMHGSLAPGRASLNRVVGALLLLVYAGFGWRRLRDAHFSHHRHAGTASDPDFHAANPRDFWPWYRLFLQRYFGWRSMLYVWTVVLVYFLVLKVPPQNIFLLYGLPAMVSSLQLFYFGTWRPHRHGADGFADRHRARSNDYGTLASLLSCFHFGYHHEHHLSPEVPWWRLPQRHQALLTPRKVNS